MAVDMIPGPGEKLKQVLFIKKRLAELKAAVEDLDREQKVISNILDSHYGHINYPTISVLVARIDILETCLKLLPELCSYCNGKRVIDYSMSWQMAMVCSFCKGTGLQANFQPKKG